MEQIAVAGKYPNVKIGFGRRLCQRSQDVIGFEPDKFVAGYPQGGDQLPRARKLWNQIVGRWMSVGLVVGIDLLAKGGAGGIEGHRQMGGIVSGDHIK